MSMDDTTITLNIESNLGNLPILRKTIRGLCSCVIQDERIFQDIDLCLNEALSNVIHHVYENQPGHEIKILVTLYPKEFVFEIVYFGKTDPQEGKPLSLPTDPLDLESVPESGRGLFLIHKLMDEVVYKSKNGMNILVLRKRFAH